MKLQEELKEKKIPGWKTRSVVSTAILVASNYSTSNAETKSNCLKICHDKMNIPKH